MQPGFKKLENIKFNNSTNLINNNMLIVPIKEGEAIEKALKKFKKKFEKTGVVKELRERSKFTKPSIVYREGKKKAIYKEQMQRNEEGQ